MYVNILSYLVNKLEIRWLCLSPIEKKIVNDINSFLGAKRLGVKGNLVGYG